MIPLMLHPISDTRFLYIGGRNPAGKILEFPGSAASCDNPQLRLESGYPALQRVRLYTRVNDLVGELLVTVAFFVNRWLE